MKVGIIGSGSMGSALANRIAESGHEVVITSRNTAEAKKVAEEIGLRVRAVPVAEVAKGVDLLIAATPASSQVEALKSAGDLSGKVIVDITNSLKPDLSGLTVGHTTSFAEELAKDFPKAKVVKAFNTIFSQVINEGPDFGKGKRAAIFFAGDEKGAKKTVRELVESMGFEAIDTGPLANARYLEAIGFLNIWLGYVAKLGPNIALTLLRREK